MPIEIGELHLKNQLELCCPRCGHPMLHHDRVTIYQRQEEDGPATQIRVGAGGRINAGPSESGNPSSRRGGIAIRFWCEMGCIFELTIEQHKGSSIIDWRKAPDSEGLEARMQLELPGISPC
jgi:hypothetical protein